VRRKGGEGRGERGGRRGEGGGGVLAEGAAAFDRGTPPCPSAFQPPTPHPPPPTPLLHLTQPRSTSHHSRLQLAHPHLTRNSLVSHSHTPCTHGATARRRARAGARSPICDVPTSRGVSVKRWAPMPMATAQRRSDHPARQCDVSRKIVAEAGHARARPCARQWHIRLGPAIRPAKTRNAGVLGSRGAGGRTRIASRGEARRESRIANGESRIVGQIRSFLAPACDRCANRESRIGNRESGRRSARASLQPAAPPAARKRLRRGRRAHARRGPSDHPRRRQGNTCSESGGTRGGWLHKAKTSKRRLGEPGYPTHKTQELRSTPARPPYRVDALDT
jgi:hypothetical protein